jgi:hypothetical protein
MKQFVDILTSVEILKEADNDIFKNYNGKPLNSWSSDDINNFLTDKKPTNNKIINAITKRFNEIKKDSFKSDKSKELNGEKKPRIKTDNSSIPKTSVTEPKEKKSIYDQIYSKYVMGEGIKSEFDKELEKYKNVKSFNEYINKLGENNYEITKQVIIDAKNGSEGARSALFILMGPKIIKLYKNYRGFKDSDNGKTIDIWVSKAWEVFTRKPDFIKRSIKILSSPRIKDGKQIPLTAYDFTLADMLAIDFKEIIQMDDSDIETKNGLLSYFSVDKNPATTSAALMGSLANWFGNLLMNAGIDENGLMRKRELIDGKYVTKLVPKMKTTQSDIVVGEGEDQMNIIDKKVAADYTDGNTDIINWTSVLNNLKNAKNKNYYNFLSELIKDMSEETQKNSLSEYGISEENFKIIFDGLDQKEIGNLFQYFTYNGESCIEDLKKEQPVKKQESFLKKHLSKLKFLREMSKIMRGGGETQTPIDGPSFLVVFEYLIAASRAKISKKTVWDFIEIGDSKSYKNLSCIDFLYLWLKNRLDGSNLEIPGKSTDDGTEISEVYSISSKEYSSERTDRSTRIYKNYLIRFGQNPIVALKIMSHIWWYLYVEVIKRTSVPIKSLLGIDNKYWYISDKQFNLLDENTTRKAMEIIDKYRTINPSSINMETFNIINISSEDLDLFK